MNRDAETSGGLDDGGEVVGDHAHSAGVLLEHRRLCCCLSKLCGRQPDSESVYCCCTRSVHGCEEEVGRVVVGVGVAGVVGNPVAEEGFELGLGDVVLES